MIWPFKKNIKKPKVVIRKDYKKLTQLAMTLKDDDGNDVDLYEFKNLEDMPNKRYSTLNEFIEDKNRGLTREELAANLDEAIKSIDEGGNMSDFTNALILLRWMRQRVEIYNDVDLIMRLVSCSLFLKDEDLLTYDWDIGTYKIELFEKNGLKSFFLSEPIKKYWTSMDISDDYMNLIIEQRKAKIQAWKELKEIGISISPM